MADRTINVRLRSRIDTEANWTSANPVLLLGELGIATNGNTVRTKVGDGTTAWNSLPWSQAPASDVYSWAKAATKPSYTAAEVGASAVGHGHSESEITNLSTDLANRGLLPNLYTAIDELADGDAVSVYDASGSDMNKFTMSQLKAFLKAYFDDLYVKTSGSTDIMTNALVMMTGTDYTTGRGRNIVLQTGTPTVSASNNGWLYGIYE